MGQANPSGQAQPAGDVAVCPWCGSFYRGTKHCQRDGQLLEPSDGVIERYRIVDRLGEGGMGAVYKAEHMHLDDRVVALKLLHREHCSDQRLVQRFFREARAASRVENPHIVDVIDFGTSAKGDSFLVMEYLQGPSLRDIIDAEAPLPLARAFTIGVRIAEGLYAAHRKGIVHRDLKPENVQLIERGGDKDWVKLLDFGIALLTDYNDARITRAGMILGTPAYMAPEQASGQELDQRADIYALGTILYEMLVGECPFRGKTAKDVLVAQLTKQPEPPKNLRRDIPTSVQEVILRALEKEPDQRPKTMLHLAYELRDALTRQTGMVPTLDDEAIDALVDSDIPATRRDLSSPSFVASPASAGADLDDSGPAPALVGVVGADADEATGPVYLPGSKPRLSPLATIAIVVVCVVVAVGITLLVVRGDKSAATASGSGGSGSSAALAAAAAAGAGSGSAGKVAETATSAAAGSGALTKVKLRTRSAARTRARATRKHTTRTSRRSGASSGSSGRKRAHAFRPSGKHYVTLRSSPPGALVATANGKRLGRTPLKVATDRARRVSVYKPGYGDKSLRLRARQHGAMTVNLIKRRMSWEVLSMGQLRKMRAAGQISRFTYKRRRRSLLKKRDAKLLRLKVQCRMGHYSKAQCKRQRKVIIDSYK